MQSLRQQFSVTYSYPVVFTRDLFQEKNPVLAEVIRQGGPASHRILLVIDSQVAALHTGLPEQVSAYGSQHPGLFTLVQPPLIVRGGDVCKNEPREVAEIHTLVARHGLCRHSFVMVIGGGAVLDAAGYAAATAHRGIRVIRLPTTVLAQNDAGVGVKNGINACGRKNFLGTFAPPFAVINDFTFLHSLPERESRAGIAEAVKVALIRDRSFFEFLCDNRHQLAQFAPEVMEQMIVTCARLHLQHISTSGDPFETGSSRPLDFGHWSAHTLEELSGGAIRHGESVAMGIALDSLYSCLSGLLGTRDLRRILALLEDLGFTLYHPLLASLEVATAMRRFQEHLGGQLAIPLLSRIGQQIDVHEIHLPRMAHCITLLAERAAGRGIMAGRPLPDYPAVACEGGAA